MLPADLVNRRFTASAPRRLWVCDVTYGATYELPQHEGTLGAYQLGKYEVTCKEYCDVLNWAKAKGYLYADAAGTPWSGSGDIYAGGTAMSHTSGVVVPVCTQYVPTTAARPKNRKTNTSPSPW